MNIFFKGAAVIGGRQRLIRIGCYSKLDYLPLFLDVKGKRCVVIGGGLVAQAKVELLRRAGARVILIAPNIREDLERPATGGTIEKHKRAFVKGDLADTQLLIAATGIQHVDRNAAEAAVAAGVPVNVVDDSTVGNIVMPAVIDRSPVVIAISSSGKAPTLTRFLRMRIEGFIPAAYGRLAELIGTFRSTVRTVIATPTERRHFWDQVIEGPIAETALKGNIARAREQLVSLLNSSSKLEAANCGEVYIIGAGPGDPDLLTFRALRLLQKADVVVYDRLVGQGILDLARRDAERTYVGKSKYHHAKSQSEINHLLIKLARSGQRVARLKGGDPFIFGRGGEELAALMGADIHVEVVPGITAGLACAAYAGIPLTHRDLAQSCLFVTGHAKDGVLDLNWAALAGDNQTLVVYMGLSTVDQFTAQLISRGRDPSTPAAIIEKGTLPNQRIVTGCLTELPSLTRTHRLKGPATIIIGDVVKLRDIAMNPLSSIDSISNVNQSSGIV